MLLRLTFEKALFLILSSKAIEMRLGALQAASFTSPGIYLPFFPLWLEGKALSPASIGLVIAIPIIVRILATAPLMSLADRSFGVRRLLLASHAGQLLGFPLLLLARDGATIVGLVALIALAQAAIIPGNDLVATRAVQKRPDLHYGRIRGYGSVSFLLTNIVAGYLVGALGTTVVIVALTLIPLLGITATLLVVPEDIGEGQSPIPPRGDSPHPKLPSVLWLIMIAAALTQGTHGALNAFASIYWKSNGFSDAAIGYFWATGVLAEIMIFIVVGGIVGRGSGVWLILLGAASAAIRFSAMSLQPGAEVTFILQAMHSLSFAATHIGTMAALTALTPREIRGQAQGLFASLAALVTATSTVSSGFIYKEAGAAVFAGMAPLGVIAFVLMLVAIHRMKAQPQSEGSGG